MRIRIFRNSFRICYKEFLPDHYPAYVLQVPEQFSLPFIIKGWSNYYCFIAPVLWSPELCLCHNIDIPTVPSFLLAFLFFFLAFPTIYYPFLQTVSHGTLRIIFYNFSNIKIPLQIFHIPVLQVLYYSKSNIPITS